MHHVDIVPSRRIGMQGHPVVPGLLYHALVVGRDRPRPDQQLGKVGHMGAERGVTLAEIPTSAYTHLSLGLTRLRPRICPPNMASATCSLK